MRPTPHSLGARSRAAHLRTIAAAALPAIAAASSLTPAPLLAQGQIEAIRGHLETARQAAGQDHRAIFGILCSIPLTTIGAEPVPDDVPAALPTIDPERTWYTEPAQVFDNLYFLGQTAFSVWAVRTSEGIILVDAIFDYSVESQVIDGLRKLGIDPDEIRYVIISHAHGDHSGGAGFLQQRGARVIMSEADWELNEASNVNYLKATRDIIATDGMEITLGDTTLRVHLTPGHTPGTISTLIPVRDGDRSHMAALWGGTLFNFRGTPENPRDHWLRMYAESAGRFGEIAREAGADIFLSNHTRYDQSTVKMPQLASRGPGDPHPYVLGVDGVRRFFTVAEECATATRLAEQPTGV